MAEHDDRNGPEVFHGVLKTAYTGRGGAVSGNTNNEKVAEALIKDYFRWTRLSEQLRIATNGC
jgi:hypothetical protein